MNTRKITNITQNPVHQGFLGKGHTAVAVLEGMPYQNTDPFIMLMDDRLDLPGTEPAGCPHPHAGFETVTLVLEGNGADWKTGSLELMTAGKGIIHTETITTKQKLRILQLWLALPPEKRWTTPRLQILDIENVPILNTVDKEIRVYSGSSNGLTSPIDNFTPFTLVDFNLHKNTKVVQTLPKDYNGFIYVISGKVNVGETTILENQAGWLQQSDNEIEDEIIMHTTEQNARFILYAARPHKANIVSYGPFIGDTQEDILRLYQEYRDGKMPHLNNIPESTKIRYTAAVQ